MTIWQAYIFVKQNTPDNIYWARGSDINLISKSPFRYPIFKILKYPPGNHNVETCCSTYCKSSVKHTILTKDSKQGNNKTSLIFLL